MFVRMHRDVYETRATSHFVLSRATLVPWTLFQTLQQTEFESKCSGLPGMMEDARSRRQGRGWTSPRSLHVLGIGDDVRTRSHVSIMMSSLDEGR